MERTIPHTQQIGFYFILATALQLTNAIFRKITQDWATSRKVERVNLRRGSLADLKRFAASEHLSAVDGLRRLGSQARTTSAVEWSNIHTNSARSSEWLHPGSAIIS
jgi:hypothetical protein